MQYSLLSKFQGALLGAALGNYVGYCFDHQADKNIKICQLLSNKNKFYLSELDKKNLQKWGDITVNCGKSLIKQQELNLEDWEKVYREWQDKWSNKKDQTYQPSQIKDSQLVEIANNNLTNFDYTNDVLNLTPSNAVIASLPVALLYHDDEFKLRQELQQWGKVWQNHLEINLSNLAVGYIIAQALTERLDPQTLIPKIINYLGEEEPLVDQLRQVEKLIAEGTNLDTAITNLSKNAKYLEKDLRFGESKHRPLSSNFLIPVSLALYCFLSTPEEFGLAVLRAARTGWAAQTCTIVATISGVYNSISGIPVEWRQKMAVELLGINDQIEILSLAKSIWAVWSGVYNPNKMTYNLVPAVAASNIIRPRPRPRSRSRKASGY